MLNYLPMYIARCLILTVIIECGVALAVGIREKYDIACVALVNALTNPLVVVSTFLVGFFLGSSARIISDVIAELSALVIEALIYSRLLEYRKMKPFFVSLLLNGASYGAGLIINSLTGG